MIRSAKDASARLSVGGVLIVGVKDVRVVVSEESHVGNPLSETTPSDENSINKLNSKCKYVPLGLLLNAELGNIPVFRLRDFVVVVPDGYERNKDIDVGEMKERVDEDLKEWEEETKSERVEGNGGGRRLLPIVQAFYFVFVRI